MGALSMARPRHGGTTIAVVAWLALILLLPARPGLGLDPQVPVDHYTLRTWKVDDGLPQSSVQVMAQGPLGYLWLGTQEGLARFDGARFTTFHRRSVPALPSNNVTAKPRIWSVPMT